MKWHQSAGTGITCQQRHVKGINFITALYQNVTLLLPVSFDIVGKTESYIDKKTGQQRRRSPKSKNQRFRTMLSQCVKNQIPFGYVLANSSFASAQNSVRWS